MLQCAMFEWCLLVKMLFNVSVMYYFPFSCCDFLLTCRCCSTVDMQWMFLCTDLYLLHSVVLGWNSQSPVLLWIWARVLHLDLKDASLICSIVSSVFVALSWITKTISNCNSNSPVVAAAQKVMNIEQVPKKLFEGVRQGPRTSGYIFVSNLCHDPDPGRF